MRLGFLFLFSCVVTLALSVPGFAQDSTTKTSLLSESVPEAVDSQTTRNVAPEQVATPTPASPIDPSSSSLFPPAPETIAPTPADALPSILMPKVDSTPFSPNGESSIPMTAVETGLRPQDQFWVIDTGHLPYVECCSAAVPQFAVSKFHCISGWQNASLPELLAETSNTLTVLYVPGNRIANEEAIRRGWIHYGNLTSSNCRSAEGIPGPIRFVVWSWPSDKIPGPRPRRDVRVKADRTSSEGWYLGWVLTQLPPESQVSLVGYSFGARIISGALHASRSGELEGIPLPSTSPPDNRRQSRVVLMAAATHNYWILPGNLHGAALQQVDRMLLLFNPCDAALKRYHMADRCEPGEALGYTGFVGISVLGHNDPRFRQIDTSGAVGRSHDEQLYLCNPSLMSQVQKYLLWDEIGN